jgi:type I restriction enzyme S subunit
MPPEGWTLRPLGALASIQRGKFSVRPRNDPRYFGGEVPFVQTGDVTRAGLFLDSYSQTLNQLGVSVSKVFPANCILMTIAANIGETAITRFPVACPDSVVAIQPRPDAADLLWLAYALASKRTHLDALAGRSAQKNINLKVLEPLQILTPPLDEQQRIGRIIRTWDRAIANAERLLANSLAQRSALTERLIPCQPGAIALGDVATFKNGLNFNAGDEGEAVKIVGVSDFKHRTQLPHTKDLATIRVPKCIRDGELLATDDLLFVRSNGNKALVGRCLYFPDVRERLAFSGFTIRCRVNPEMLLPAYAASLVRSDAVRAQMLVAGGGTNIQNLSQQALAKLRITLPPLAQQQRVARLLGACDREIVVAELLLENRRLQKQVVMDELLTGFRRSPGLMHAQESS